jgi:hypothetical protein
VNDAARTSPDLEYPIRLAERRRAHATLLVSEARHAYARIVVFVAGAVLAWAVVYRDTHPAALVVPIGAFVILAKRHDIVIRARDAAARAIAFYDRGLARLEDRWAGGGEPGDRFRGNDHLYADDLDLFGRGSLFELLSIARTRAGEETLAGWLKTPAGVDEVRARQEAVRELTPQLDFREQLAMAGTDVRAAVLTDALVAWAAAPPLFASRWLRPVAWVMPLLVIVAGVVWVRGGPGALLFGAIAAEAVFTFALTDRVRLALHGSDRQIRDLHVLAHALERVEAATFTSPRLQAIAARIARHDAASTAIRRLHRLSEMHDWQHNMVFVPIAFVLLWGPHLAFAVEAWRRRHGRDVGAWLVAVGEVEALSSLATYRYEHPDDPFPEFLDGPATLAGTSLGHPLLPSARAVRNDVQLTGDTRLLVISGSNMSGKSTYLRTCGINVVLALAGAPVRAHRLALTPLAPGATLRIQDSLQEGRSRFYAEITRLRQLHEAAAASAPLFFLLDELLHGTNSHDRLVGARGVLHGLLDRGAIGMITTHDLALTSIADDLAPRAVNVHFEDRFESGEITFDYTMRPGPVTRSNALALMRAVGLEVPQE